MKDDPEELLSYEAMVWFEADLNLPEVGELISRHLFGGLPFVPFWRYEDVPQSRLEKPIMGFYVTITAGASDYTLELRSGAWLLVSVPQAGDRTLQYEHIGTYIAQCLSAIAEFRIVKHFK